MVWLYQILGVVILKIVGFYSTKTPIAYQLSCLSFLSTIVLIDCCAYQPSCLSTIVHIDHSANQPSCILTIVPINHHAFSACFYRIGSYSLFKTLCVLHSIYHQRQLLLQQQSTSSKEIVLLHLEKTFI